MSCEGCPEKYLGGVAYIVYTGGPENAPFAVMHAFPKPDDSIIRHFAFPTISKDGQIEYAKGPIPPVPEGYQALTPWVLKPIWVFCALRLYCVRLNDEGYLDIVGKCLNAASDIGVSKITTNAFCQTCPVRVAYK